MPKSAAHPNLKVIFIVAVLALGGFVYLKNNQLSSNKTLSVQIQKTKTFKSSDVMDFNINTPTSFSIEEKFGQVTIKNTEGIITVDKIGSDYSDLKQHLSDKRIQILQKLSSVSEETIGGLESISGYINNSKLYFIMSENRVYTLSTDSASLYSTLDQIAHSFRYTPN